jgi:hypothetical protein
MANKPPFSATIPTLSRTTGEQNPAIGAHAQNRALYDIQREQVKGQNSSDLDARGNSVAGTDNTQTVQAKFTEANKPLFIGHDFGYTVRNWTIVDKCGSGDIHRPQGRQYAPNKNGMWLQSDTANCEVRIRFDGQREQA